MPLKRETVTLKLRAAWEGTKFVFLDTFSRRGGFEGTAYRVQPVPFALSQAANGVIPLLLLILHGPPHLRSFAMAFLGFKISVGSAIIAFIVSRYFPIMINEKELRARNWTGVARRIGWEEIIAVKKIRWLYVAPVLRISTSRERDHILLPLFLENQEDFSARVRAWTLPANPLHRFLKETAAQTQRPSTDTTPLSSEDVALR